MKINQINEDEILKQAQIKFADKYIKLEQDHVFLKDYEVGTYTSEWLDHEFFVSTNYAYENILVNGNKTRYLVNAQTIWVSDRKDQVIFNPENHYYYVVEEGNEILFYILDEFQSILKKSIVKIADE